MLILWVSGWEPLPGRERGTQGTEREREQKEEIRTETERMMGS